MAQSSISTLLHHPPSAEEAGVFSLFRSLFTGMLSSKAKPQATAAPVQPNETVEELLEGLEGEHVVLKEVQTRYGSIDHVVLSKDHGVVLIETKPHSGRVSVVDAKLRLNGKLPDKDFVSNSLMNTYWVIEEIRTLTGIDPSIRPLIVFTNASVSTGRPLKGIPITDKRSLLDAITHGGEAMESSLWAAREKMAAHFANPASCGIA
jgi:hypothetical protein